MREDWEFRYDVLSWRCLLVVPVEMLSWHLSLPSLEFSREVFA